MPKFMKKYFRYLREDRLIFRLFALGLFFILLTLLYALLNYSQLPPLLPVFNQLPWGVDRLGNSWGIFIPSLIVLLIFSFNILLSAFIYSYSPLISRLFAVTSFLISLLNLLFIVRTILLIT